MKRVIFLMITVLIYTGCKEEGRIDHIDDSAPAPAPVLRETVRVTPKPGGAVIKYGIPQDKNLLGVKVVYTRNGEVCESKASKYTDSLLIEGFGNTEPQEAQLYSIGFNSKLSEPVTVPFTPLVSPVQTVKFDMEGGFGGVVVSLEENYSEADLALVLLFDTLGFTSGSRRQWMELQTFYTASAAMKFSRRGLKVIPVDFALYVRDRWGNSSDTIYKNLTPIEEIKLPKTDFRNANLPSDFFMPAEGNNNYRLENIWNGGEAANSNFFASGFSGPMPQWFTIDLGRKMSISRIQKWPRANFELYSGSAPRIFQVWGSMNPNPDGSWDDSWTLLGEFEQFKPSGYGEGLEIGPITDEDRDYWYNRTEFELVPTENAPDPYMTVTHLRIKVLSTYTTYGSDATNGQVIIAELTFWGQLMD